MEKCNTFSWRKQTLLRKLETRGFCFLCQNIFGIREEEVQRRQSPSSSVSLRCLRLHLQINLKKFVILSSSSEPINHCQIQLKEGGEVGVDLCKPCEKLIFLFSKKFQNLERTRMEVDYFLENINRRISLALCNPERIQNYSRTMTSHPQSLHQLPFVDKLRKEIASEISSLITNYGIEPKVELERLKDRDLQRFRLSGSATSSPSLTTDFKNDNAKSLRMKTSRDFHLTSPPVAKKHFTNGCCFFCLTLTTDPQQLQNDFDDDDVICVSFFRCLCRYLQIHASPSKDEIEVSDLCKPCDKLLGIFSRKFQDLEKLQMEVRFSLKEIERRISTSQSSMSSLSPSLENTGAALEESQQTTSTYSSCLVDKFRKEIAKKLASRVTDEGWCLRVHLDKLTQDKQPPPPPPSHHQKIQIFKPKMSSESAPENSSENNGQKQDKDKPAAVVEVEAAPTKNLVYKPPRISTNASSASAFTESIQFPKRTSKQTDEHLCDICGFSSKFNEDWRNHSKKCSSESGTASSTSTKTRAAYPIPAKRRYETVLNSETGKLELKCDTCNSSVLSCRTALRKLYYLCRRRGCFGVRGRVHSESKSSISMYNKNEETGMFDCTSCSKSSTERSIAGEHFKSAHLHMYDCEICGKRLSKKENLILHRNICDGVKKIRGFVYYKDLNSGRFCCKGCDLTFEDRHRVRHHYDRVHLQMKPIIQLTQQQRQDRPRPHKCNICKTMSFTSKFILRKHEKRCAKNIKELERRAADPKYKFICSICGKHFASRTTKHEHEKIVHMKEESRFSCDLCQKKWKSIKLFKLHEKSKAHLEAEAEAINKNNTVREETAAATVATIDSSSSSTTDLVKKEKQEGDHDDVDAPAILLLSPPQSPDPDPASPTSTFSNTPTGEEEEEQVTEKVIKQEEREEIDDKEKISSSSPITGGLSSSLSSLAAAAATTTTMTPFSERPQKRIKIVRIFKSKRRQKKKSFIKKEPKSNNNDESTNPKYKFPCATCGKRFMRKGAFLTHFKLVHVENSTTAKICNICGVSWRNQRQFYKHKKTCSGGGGGGDAGVDADSPMMKNFHLCDKCGKHFKLRKYLYRHKQTCGGGENAGGSHLCDKCGKIFKIQLSLFKHATHCTGEETRATPTTPNNINFYEFDTSLGKYKCKVSSSCSEEFLTEPEARSHLLSVHFKDGYKCNICDIATFKIIGSLNKHQKTCKDTKEKRLALHHAKKTDFKKYKLPCPICGKRFECQSFLQRHHRVVHLKVKSWKCDLCDKAYTTSNTLQEHKNSVHLKIEHFCEFCNKKFFHRATHRRHVKQCAKTNNSKLQTS